MISLLKALIPGALLTWIVSEVMLSGGSRGGFLNIHQIAIASTDIAWSWPLFIAATGLAWVLIISMK